MIQAQNMIGEVEGDDFDPILSQVLYNYELTVNREMGRAIVNLSGSPLYVGAADFSCACLDEAGNTLTNISWSLQMGYAISNTVKTTIELYGDDIHPGDMIYCNDPYLGGGLHSSDVVLVTPIFDRDNELLMWVGVCAHVTDVGGPIPGSFSMYPVECYGENLRFTPVKFYDEGEYKEDIVRAFLTNVRLADRTEIDLKAMMGANWLGRERMIAMIDQHGVDTIRKIHRTQIRQSERAMRERIRLLPDGVYEGAAHMEHDGEDDFIYTVRARVIVEGDELTVDYSDTDKEAKGVLNCTDIGSRGNIVAAVGTVLAPDIPFNEGVLAPVHMISPKGTLVNSIKPAPIAGATVFGAWFGTDAIIEALNYAIAGNTETEHRRTGPWGSWTWSFLHCTNQYGDPWFFVVFTGGAGGGGALPFKDGVDAILGIQTVDAFTANVEDYEMQSPVLFQNRRLAKDTGGAGKYRGGLGLESVCVPWQTDGWSVVVNHNRLTAPSSAVSGGYPGGGSAIRFAPGMTEDVLERYEEGRPLPIDDYIAGSEQTPTRAYGIALGKNDGYYIRATGGPGYGDPLDRDPAAVTDDLVNDRVSLHMARSAYGVIADGSTFAVDQTATEKLRTETRDARKTWPLTKDVLGDLFAARNEQPGGISGERQILGESLEVDAEGSCQCRRCGHHFSGNRENWKWHAAFQQAAASPEAIKAPIKVRPEQDLVFRQYACPGCGVQVDTEVALVHEAPRWNYRPLAVWRESETN